jgi:hypothetical protein
VTGKEAFKEITISAEIKEERSARKILSRNPHRETGVTGKLRSSRKEHRLQRNLVADVRTETKE